MVEHRKFLVSHPFLDGGKRVGAHAALLFLRAHAAESLIFPADLTEVTLAVAKGGVSAEALAIWIRQRVRQRAR